MLTNDINVTLALTLALNTAKETVPHPYTHVDRLETYHHRSSFPFNAHSSISCCAMQWDTLGTPQRAHLCEAHYATKQPAPVMHCHAWYAPKPGPSLCRKLLHALPDPVASQLICIPHCNPKACLQESWGLLTVSHCVHEDASWHGVRARSISVTLALRTIESGRTLTSASLTPQAAQGSHQWGRGHSLGSMQHSQKPEQPPGTALA